VNEVQEALTSPSKMTQYHALALLHKLRQHDRLAISKIVTALARNPPRGPVAVCLQIRIIGRVIATMPDQDHSELLKYLKQSLSSPFFMVGE